MSIAVDLAPAAEPAAAPEPLAPVVEEIAEEIEEVVTAREPQARVVTFAVDADADEDVDEDYEDEDGNDEDGDDEDGDEDDEEDDEEAEDLATAMAHLTQLLMTEEGEAVTDVLLGVRDALEKQNKILYRGVQVLEQWASRSGMTSSRR